MISVIICTRNRCELVKDCIESLLHQDTDKEYEVIVVDNNSTDNTAEVVQNMVSGNKKLRYTKEEKTGLSHARNTGYVQAKNEWVAYVDDDARIHQDFVAVACKIIEEKKFDCFGGIYNAWFKYGKPDWLPADFGSNRKRMPDYITILKKRSFSGGVAVYRKKMLEDLGGFPIEYGMVGGKIGYGEENYIQVKARESGYLVGFVPELQIDHIVNKYKLEKKWHYEDAYEKGGTQARLNNEKIKFRIMWNAILEILKYPLLFIRDGSTFLGNRNVMYYIGYFDQIFKRNR